MDWVFSTISALGKTAELLEHLLPFLRKKRDLNGRWSAIWTHDGKQTEDVIELKHFIHWVRGKTYHKNQICFIKGHLNAEGIFQGEWGDTDPKVAWDGVFQLEYSHIGNVIKMEGKWLGKGASGLNSGEWVWIKS